jgi:multidrug resistance efflux pump
MSLFEVDLDALQLLETYLGGIEEEVSSYVSSLTSANNQFDSSFMSLDKGQYEQVFQEIITNMNHASARADEIRVTLFHLQALVQQAAQLSF